MFKKDTVKKTMFFSGAFFLKTKNAIVSLNTFALLIMLYLAIFITSYWFYYDSKQESIIIFKEKECLNSALTFRANVIDTIKYPNSSLIYVYPYVNDNIVFNIKNNSIGVKQDLNLDTAQVNISSLGINFCSDYNFSQSDNIVINYNGSCVLISN